MTDPVRHNDDRPTIDKVDLVDNDSDEFGWPYGLLLGLDHTRGWCLEFDMQDGKLISALTPAGVDPILLMQVSETQATNQEGFRTTVNINVEYGKATWDEKTKTLRIEG